MAKLNGDLANWDVIANCYDNLANWDGDLAN